MRDIPIGVQDFKKMRDGGYYYVDKTELIEQILDSPGTEVFQFTRPRRFGKSLNLSMLDAFLNVRYQRNRWFDGLRISEREDLLVHKNSSPVIYFDFKDLDSGSYEGFIQGMRNKMADLYGMNAESFSNAQSKPKTDFDSIMNKSSDIDTLCRSLLYLARSMEIRYGKKVILLLDEYDNPIQNAYGENDFERILDFMRIMLGSVLKGNESLGFAVMTGVLQISKESIFSGLNNLYVNNIFSKASDEMFGFTPSEVQRLCEDYGHPERYEEAREWYDGYVFGDAEIYNPWSLLSYVKNGMDPKAYWTGTSGNSIIKDLMSRTDINTTDNLRILASGGAIRQKVDPTVVYGDIHSNRSAIYSIMAMSGYLKAIPRENHHELSIPNKEIYGVFADMMSANLIEGSSALEMFTDAVVGHDVETMSRTLYDMISESVGFKVLDNEHSYQAFITGMLLYLSGRYDVTADMESGNGFYDIRMQPRREGDINIVLELKRRKRSDGRKTVDKLAMEAIDQIKGKDYYHGMRGNTILYGIAFDSKLPYIVSERLNL